MPAEGSVDYFPRTLKGPENEVYTVSVWQGSEPWKPLHVYSSKLLHHSGVLAKAQCAFIADDVEGEEVVVRLWKKKGRAKTVRIRPMRHRIPSKTQKYLSLALCDS